MHGNKAAQTQSALDVAAAVIQRPDGTFLLAQRPAGKVYEGYWEFPGGKFEKGERPAQALARELHEELGIEVEQSYPWINRVHVYAHAAVRLHFLRVVCWRGEPVTHEHQQFVWQAPGALTVGPMLPANEPILKALQLPSVYGITNASEIGERESLQRLQRALESGLRLVQVREKAMNAAQLSRFAMDVIARCKRYGAQVLINENIEVARKLEADGVHLTSEQLLSADARPSVAWCAASCHDPQDLSRAAHMGVDFVVLGPVQGTPSHPQLSPLGWQRFTEIACDSGLPVFAIGGMRSTDLQRSWEAGAHGIAMIRGAWQL